MRLTTHLAIASIICSKQTTAKKFIEYDLVVYGGTSAGVAAAVQARKMGRSVVLVCPDIHLGGLSSGGSGWTATGKKRLSAGSLENSTTACRRSTTNWKLGSGKNMR
jgi:NADPH-dependent 2,4-dienoyl-CoA reductase/sulfur reductase-like enzyme